MVHTPRCCTCAASRASSSSTFQYSPAAFSFPRVVLSANSRPVFSSRATQTRPMPPDPIGTRSWNLPSLLPALNEVSVNATTSIAEGYRGLSQLPADPKKFELCLDKAGQSWPKPAPEPAPEPARTYVKVGNRAIVRCECALVPVTFADSCRFTRRNALLG